MDLVCQLKGRRLESLSAASERRRSKEADKHLHRCVGSALVARRKMDRLLLGCVSRVRRRRFVQQEDQQCLVERTAEGSHSRVAIVSSLDRLEGWNTHSHIPCQCGK